MAFSSVRWSVGNRPLVRPRPPLACAGGVVEAATATVATARAATAGMAAVSHHLCDRVFIVPPCFVVSGAPSPLFRSSIRVRTRGGLTSIQRTDEGSASESGTGEERGSRPTSPAARPLYPHVLPDEHEEGGMLLTAGTAVPQMLGDGRQEGFHVTLLQLSLDVLVEKGERLLARRVVAAA